MTSDALSGAGQARRGGPEVRPQGDGALLDHCDCRDLRPAVRQRTGPGQRRPDAITEAPKVPCMPQNAREARSWFGPGLVIEDVNPRSGDAVEPPIGIEPMTYSLRGSYTHEKHSTHPPLPRQPRQVARVSPTRLKSCMPKIRPEPVSVGPERIGPVIVLLRGVSRADFVRRARDSNPGLGVTQQRFQERSRQGTDLRQYHTDSAVA
jgi:hypothetical protein